MKKPITTRVHGILDYSVGILLLLLPHICGFADVRPAASVTMTLGVTTLLYSLSTRYELGLFPLIPMKGHLLLDGLSAAFLILSPWLLGFAERVYLPHVLMGLLEIGAVLMTQTEPKEIPHPERV
jgi:hypothetical protein